jgi:hypothetical protein
MGSIFDFFSIWLFQHLAIFSASGFFSVWQYFQRLAFSAKLIGSWGRRSMAAAGEVT